MSIRDDARFIVDPHLGPYGVEFLDDEKKAYLRIYPRRSESNYEPPWIGIAWIVDPVASGRGRVGSWRLFDLTGNLGPPVPEYDLPLDFDFAPFLDIARDMGLAFSMEE